ncbi:MAG: hypothetical protein JSV44_09670 [Candidatus Zixiibacteriota bacterium]|nr:MAG: hypothetical protein JSV44_09670 [candidate division Zixibacteria bacterium]
MPLVQNTLKRYFIPLTIYLVMVGIYVGYSVIADNFFLFKPVWDIKHYIDISETGYEARPCTPDDYPPGRICGNVGWYPAWPIAIKIFRPLLGGSSHVTFIALAFAFTLAGFLLLFRFIQQRHNTGQATLTLLAAAFGPASFYFLSGFPYALFLLLLMLYFFLLYASSDRSREIGLFLVAIAISAAYPTGILVAVVPAVWFIFSRRERAPSVSSVAYWATLARYVVPFALGVLLLWMYFYFKFDNFFIQLDFQEKYQRTQAIPFVVMYKSLVNYPVFSPENAVIIWYGLAFVLFLPFRLKHELLVLGLLLFLFSPATGTTMSIYRHYLIVLPAYMVIGTSDRPLWLKILFIAFGLILSLTVLFPTFMASRLI